MTPNHKVQFKEIKLLFTQEQMRLYKTGVLWNEWIESYPNLFKKNKDWCENQFQIGYCFFEMLTVMHIFRSTGLINLSWGRLAPKNLEEYKKEILKKRFSDELYNLAVFGGEYSSRTPQPPDFLFYHPTDVSQWFFCEVKGARDRLSPQQKAYFTEINKLSNGRVYICKFNEFKPEK